MVNGVAILESVELLNLIDGWVLLKLYNAKEKLWISNNSAIMKTNKQNLAISMQVMNLEIKMQVDPTWIFAATEGIIFWVRIALPLTMAILRKVMLKK